MSEIATLDTLVGDARQRLLARARREGLADVGYAVADSPVGPLWLAVGPRGLAALTFGSEPSPLNLGRLLRAYGPGIVPDGRRTDTVRRQLDEYFAGRRRRFETAVDLSALTPFQQRVLQATARVGFGELTTYRTVAARAGNPAASRAAGAAVGSNPVAIVVPCHRVVASDGSLGGYGGGLDAKRLLLALERDGDVPPGGWIRTRR